jgi:hypothetical protein
MQMRLIDGSPSTIPRAWRSNMRSWSECATPNGSASKMSRPTFERIGNRHGSYPAPLLSELARLLLQVLGTGARRRRGREFDVVVRRTARVRGAVG